MIPFRCSQRRSEGRNILGRCVIGVMNCNASISAILVQANEEIKANIRYHHLTHVLTHIDFVIWQPRLAAMDVNCNSHYTDAKRQHNTSSQEQRYHSWNLIYILMLYLHLLSFWTEKHDNLSWPTWRRLLLCKWLLIYARVQDNIARIID